MLTFILASIHFMLVAAKEQKHVEKITQVETPS